MTKYSGSPATHVTDKGTAFTSTIIAGIAQFLGITLKCATTKHSQTAVKLERTHASLQTNLKKRASEIYRRQWLKYLPLAVLSITITLHNTVAIGCEPSKVCNGGIPCNDFDRKLGVNPDKNFLPTTNSKKRK